MEKREIRAENSSNRGQIIWAVNRNFWKKLDASVSKIINACVYDFSNKERITMHEITDLSKHSVIFRESTLKKLVEMKSKFNIPQYIILNLSIREGIDKINENKRLLWKASELPKLFMKGAEKVYIEIEKIIQEEKYNVELKREVNFEEPKNYLKTVSSFANGYDVRIHNFWNWR